MEDYRITNRGGKGVTTLKITEKTGNLVAIKQVNDTDDLMIITKNGITIRFEVAALRVMGRNTQGVKVIKVSNNDEISSITKIEKEEILEIEEGAEMIEGATLIEGSTEIQDTQKPDAPEEEQEGSVSE